MQEDILLFSEGTFPNGKEQPDLPTQDATYGLYIYVINVCVCTSWCQSGLTPEVQAQNQGAKHEPLHTRKSFDCIFITSLLKWTGSIFTFQDLYKLHISYFFPLSAET